jgi:hypothetical protein
MTLRNQKPAFILGGIVLFYFAAAELFLLAVPQPREPLQYMVAGAFATGISLLVAFAVYALGRFSLGTTARTARRSAQSS